MDIFVTAAKVKSQPFKKSRTKSDNSDKRTEKRSLKRNLVKYTDKEDRLQLYEELEMISKLNNYEKIVDKLEAISKTKSLDSSMQMFVKYILEQVFDAYSESRKSNNNRKASKAINDAIGERRHWS